MKALWVVIALGVGACTVVNRVEVCEVAAPRAQGVNQFTDGAQAVDGVAALAALPDQGAFVVFTTAPANDDDGTGPAGVRGALLDANGRLVATCGSTAEKDYALAGAAGTRSDQPSVAMPGLVGDDTGLVVWRARSGAGQRVMGRFVTRAGCPATDAFPIDERAVDRVERPSVAWLGRRRFVVAWSRVSVTPAPALVGFARVLEFTGPTGPTFLPTALRPDGEPAALVREGNGAVYLRVARVGDAQFAALWYDTITQLTWFGAYNDRFVPASPLHPISEQASLTSAAGRIPGGGHVALASDGAQLLTAWIETDGQNARRLKGRFLSPGGEALSAGVAPTGGSFVVSDVPATEEGRVALAPMSDGGFFAVWEDATLSAGRARGLRAAVFDGGGARRFVPIACDPVGFDLAGDEPGTRRSPAAVRLVDGSILAVWTAQHPTGTDRSGTGVRSLRLPRAALAYVP